LCRNTKIIISQTKFFVKGFFNFIFILFSFHVKA